MASIYDLKPQFQNLLRPLVAALFARGFTANQVTVSAAVLSIGHGLLMASYPASGLWFVLLPLVLFIRMALNAIDGMLAREHGQKSPVGAMLNELCDVIADAALYLPFALVSGLSPWIAVISVVLAGLTEMTGVAALAAGAERRYDGPMGKSDRAAAFGTLGFLLGLGLLPLALAQGAQWIILALLVATVVNRARRALKLGAGR